MAFQRPTFTELVDRISSDLRAQLESHGKRADVLLRRSKIWVLARVYAAMAYTIYGTIGWVSKQMLPVTATDIDYLQDFGALYGVFRLDPTIATGVVKITGAPGVSILNDFDIYREDGTRYTVTAPVHLNSNGEGFGSATALSPGAEGNMQAGQLLNISIVIANIDPTVEAVSGFVDGSDLEDIEDYRARILNRTRHVPHGGAAHDYVNWTLEVPGVYRAKCLPTWRGPGTVDVIFLAHDGTNYLGYPTLQQIQAVQDVMDEKAPVTANVLARPPAVRGFDVHISSLVPDTLDVRGLIEDAIRQLTLDKALDSDKLTISELYNAINQIDEVSSFQIITPGVVHLSGDEIPSFLNLVVT